MKNQILGLTIVMAAAVSVSVSSHALGAISLGDAADIGRAAAPADHTLLQVELRERDGIIVFQTDHYPAGAATEFEVRINPEDGTIIESNVDVTDPSDQSEALAVLARMDEVLIDFSDAVAIVAEAAADLTPEKIQLDVEDGVVVYQVELLDTAGQDARFYVNATNGAIHDQNDNDEDTAPNDAFGAAIDIAVASTGSIALEAEAENQGGTLHIEVLLFNEATGLLTELDVAVSSGEILSSLTYEPGPSQAERIAEILALLPDATVTFSEAIAIASKAFPGSQTHEIELKVEDIGLIYEVELIMEFMEIEVHVSAVGGAAETASSHMPLVGDFNLDGTVSVNDVIELIGMWSSTNPLYDLDLHGEVEVSDLLMLLEGFEG
ncbi:MAG: hypothetical protein HOO04_07925 [Phycisphaerae bacterium]|nr:hypothetical protein [Phycisphaerae bacterium]MBT5656526.1 hypothetical protein [Phycisphaerae bacterium]MBT7454059.1 hypothetical protein [Gemmatimonadota bacterium]